MRQCRLADAGRSVENRPQPWPNSDGREFLLRPDLGQPFRQRAAHARPENQLLGFVRLEHLAELRQIVAARHQSPGPMPSLPDCLRHPRSQRGRRGSPNGNRIPDDRHIRTRGVAAKLLGCIGVAIGHVGWRLRRLGF